MCVCVCVCVSGRNELEVCTKLAYPHITSFRIVPYTSTRILKPFQGSKPMGIKVDIAQGLHRGTPTSKKKKKKQSCKTSQLNSLHGFERVEPDVEDEDDQPGGATRLPDQRQLHRVGQNLSHLVRAAEQLVLELFCCLQS